MLHITVRSFREYPYRSVSVIGAIALAGLAESIGLVALLPLLQIAVGGEGAAPLGSQVSGKLERVASIFGFSVSVGYLLSFIAIVIIAKAILTVVAMSHLGFVVAHITTALRLRLIRALLKTSWSHFTSEATGRLGNAISTEAVRASQAYMASWQMLAATLQAAILLGTVMLLSWQLSLAAVGIGLLLFLALSRAMSLARRAGESQTHLLNSLVTRLTDFIQGIKPIKAMGQEERVAPLLEHEAEGLNVAQRRETIATALLGAVPEPILAIALAIGLYVSLTYWKIPITELMVLAIFFNRSTSRFAQIQKHAQALLICESAYWSLNSAIETAENRAESGGQVTAPTIRNEISFDHVNFSYGQKGVLTDCNIRIRNRSLTALIGPSGSGKTTIADLMLGLYRPASGEIWVDDIRLQDINLKSWRQRVGYVPQDPFLFHDTVITNISLGDPGLSRERVLAALDAAGARAFVDQLEHGIDTVIGERGLKLSGGQRQRLAIARALVRSPQLLILDEATASLDTETEAAICATVAQLARDICVLAISHQPAILSVADHVYRFESGNVIESDPKANRRKAV